MEMIDRILEILNERGISNPQFYTAIGISKSTFSRWKAKKISISVKNVEKIADYLGVSVDSLLGKQ